MCNINFFFFFFSSRRRHTRLTCDWSPDVCSSDLEINAENPKNVGFTEKKCSCSEPKGTARHRWESQLQYGHLPKGCFSREKRAWSRYSRQRICGNSTARARWMSRLCAA